MYTTVDIKDAVSRFLNDDPLGAQFAGVADDRTFGDLIVKIADRLNERLRHLGWKTTPVTGSDPESLAGMSIRCLRSLGPAFLHGRSDSVVHQQAFFTLLLALTSMLEQAEVDQVEAAPRPVRVRRFLSSPDEIADHNAPLEIAEEIGRY